MPLLASEQARYREVGGLAAEAASEALRAARPDWSEQELAGACARALWSRGLHAVYVLAAGAERFERYRRAPPAQVMLGAQAVLALCARRFGLCASLSRQRRFGPAQHRSDGAAVVMDDADAAMLALEAVALDACETGHALSMVYHALDSAYAYAGQPDTVRTSRQGGIHGYLAPEVAAGAHTEIILKRGMALAFHPSLPGSTVEDTFLLDGGQ
ncbi:MAG: peptidase M24, partial [Janthinobacterium sp.]